MHAKWVRISNHSVLKLIRWRCIALTAYGLPRKIQDSILDSLITIGLEENKDLLIATARIEQSEAILGITRADLYPSFGYSVGASRGNVNNGAVLSPDGDALNLLLKDFSFFYK